MDRIRNSIRKKPREDEFDDDEEFDDDPQGFAPVVGPNGVIERPPPRHHDHPSGHGQPQHGHHQNGHPQHGHHPDGPPHHHQQHHHQRPQHHHHQGPFPGDGTNNIPSTSATRSGRLQVALQNDTSSNNVFAYITGQAIDNGNALFLLSADGETPYFPSSPQSTGTRLDRNISIDLGAPGNTVRVHIPRLAGGRIWFSVGEPLVFALNPGPGLVEPSIFNQADPNHNTNFGFAEFTFNNAQVFANISYVDFVGLPIAMSLEDTNRRTQHVSGMPADGLHTIAQGLRAQTQRDGRRWSSLIVNRKDGHLLRILSPNSGVLLNPNWFQDYWTNYVNQVYGRYSNSPLTIDTQAQFGDVNGRVAGGGINFGGGGVFRKPRAEDIFSCSTGPFATGQNAQTNTIIPRLAAAFNRSTLLLTDNHPDGVGPRQYYQNPTTNVCLHFFLVLLSQVC